MAEEKKDHQPQGSSAAAGASGAAQQQSDEQKLQSLMEDARREMEEDHVVDETAATVVYPADVGYSAHALVKGVTTSPSIIARVKREQAMNADPDRANKLFARDVLGLDAEVDGPEEHPEDMDDGVYGGESSDRLKG